MQLILESIDPHGERAKAIRMFYSFACDKLGVVGGPKVNFTPHLGTTSFGLYSPSEDIVTVAVEGRHISDILRTFAHELVHHVQLIDSTDPSNRSVEDLEYEANAVAGMLMRDYNKLHPEMFGLSDSVEPQATPPEGFPGTPGQGFFPGNLGDSQSAASPDVTRPSGPIELAELSNKTLASYKTKALQARKAGQRKWWHGVYGAKGWEFPNSGKPYPESPQRTKGIETAAKKLKARYAHLNELSNKTLARYKRNAKAEVKNVRRVGPDGKEFGYRIDFLHNLNKFENRKKGIKQAETKLKARYAHLKEDGAVVNSAGSGAIAGLGIGPQGEPGVHPRKKKSPILAPMVRRKTFKQLKEELS